MPISEASGKNELIDDLVTRYGPLMGGATLRQALGYQTWAAFDRSIKLNQLGIPVFSLPGRRGRYALTVDVGSWLFEAREAARDQERSKEGI